MPVTCRALQGPSVEPPALFRLQGEANMARELRMPQAFVEASLSPSFWDEFQYYVSTDFWTSLTTGGTVAMANVEPFGPVLQLVGDGTIEHECAVYGTTAGFLPALGHPLSVVCEVQFAQGATSK